MSAEEIGNAIRAEAVRVHDDRDHLNKQVKVHVHPDDWDELLTDPPRTLFEDGAVRAVFGCTIVLDADAVPGAPTAE